MTTLRDIFTAFASESLERSPHLPIAHRKVISAIQQCQSGSYGHSLYQCPSGGGPHRVNHACGNRHCPQCPQPQTPQWLQPHLDKQLPGPPFFLTFTVPETLRPFIRSHQRLAYQAMFQASATALKRLATDERFIGTDLQGSPALCTPGAGTSSTTPTSTPSSLAVAFPRTAPPGAPPEPHPADRPGCIEAAESL